MKTIVFFLLSGLATTASAGQVVCKSMYATTTFVQGTGQTDEAAVKDAVATMPDGYQRDPASGQVIECTISEDMLRATDGESCDPSIQGNQFRITIPVISLR